MSSPDDQQLDTWAARTVAGDHHAFDQLVLALQADVRLHLLMRGANGDEVEELVQESFVDGFRTIASYRGPGTLRAWFKGIARHRLLRHLRERRRLVSLVADQLEEQVVDAQLDKLIADEEPVRERIRLEHCLDRLGDRPRRLIERRYFDGASLTTLAQAYKLTKQKVAYRLMRIRQQLGRCLEGGS